MSCNPIYRFEIISGDTVYEVSPDYDDELAKLLERADGGDHFTDSLSGALTFVRDDYDLIMGFDPNEVLFFNIYIKYPFEEEFELFFKGRFSKSDTTVDDDEKNVEVKVESNSGTQQVLNGLNREYNLVDIAPETSAIRYTVQPILQVYVSGASFINNYINGTNSEVPVLRPSGSGSPYNETELLDDYKFSVTTVGTIAIIPHYPGMPVDVSGTYLFDTATNNGFTRDDGVYRFARISGRWRIRSISNGEDIYQTDPVPFGTSIFNDNDFEQGVPLSPVGFNGPDIYGFQLKIYSRLISPVEVLNGVQGEELPEDDIAPSSDVYRWVIPEANVPTIVLSSEFSDDPTRWGKYASDAVGLSGRYFKEPVGGAPSGAIDKPFAVSPAEWKYYSVWFYYPEDLAGAYGVGQVIGVNDGYQLHDAISSILKQFTDEVKFDNTPEYSDFFYGDNNPVRGVRKYPVIVPKSNILEGEYERAATRAEIRLRDIMELIENFHNCSWFVDEENRLRIEHKSFFENGSDYVSGNVEVDLTMLVDPQTGLPWTHGTNAWTYSKEEIPVRMEFSMMDKMSRAFEGYAIESTSPYAQQDQIEPKEIGKFTSDVDYMYGNPSEISPRGFGFFEAVLDPGGFIAPFVDIELDNGESFRLQNGFASFIYAHEQYFKSGMPFQKLIINRVEVDIGGGQKARRQELEFAYNKKLTGLGLIRSGLGDGIVKRLEINLSTLNIKTTLAHDII
jgi:hypothetical protein